MATSKAFRISVVLGVAMASFATTAVHASASSAGSYCSILNSERAAHGLPALTERSDLDAIAASWSAHMAAANSLQHNPQLANVVHNWQAVGENVGEGPTIADLDSAFMASTEHRDNILDPTYRDVGVGVASGSGVLWITVDFRQPEWSSQPLPHTTYSSGASVARTVGAVPRVQLLQQGDVGRPVARLQARLHVRADGIYGVKTERAVMRFQRLHRLRVDGVAGPQTMRAMRHTKARRNLPQLQVCDQPGAISRCGV
jgi:peptidoglycan hydrolase-like protein with peptidoglycan-binding domain